jgi:hypothetical protein
MTDDGVALGPLLLTALLPGCGLLAWGVALIIRPPTSRSVARWSQRHGLTATDPSMLLIARYLRYTRGVRFIGSGLGWLFSPVVLALTHQGIPLFGVSILVAITGYIVGGVVAETAFGRPFASRSDLRSASLSPRLLPDYVSSISVWSLRVLIATTIGLALAFVAMPKRPPTPGDPSLALVAGTAVLLSIFAFAIERILWLIVERPQPVTNADLVAADDAIRASSIHAISGAGIAMLLVGVGAELFWLQFTASAESLRQLLGWPATLAIVFALAICLGFGRPETGRVRHDGGLSQTP